MDAVELLRSRNRFAIALETGLNCEIRLPDMNDALLSGDIPMPVLEYMARDGTPQPEHSEENGKAEGIPNLDFLRQFRLYQRELVMRTLLSVEGMACEMNMDAVTALQPSEFDELYAYGSRHKPLPKADTPQ